MPNNQVCPHTLWKREFNEQIADLGSAMGSRHAAENLRYMMVSGLLAMDDIKKDPEKFFLAHRMLAREVPRIGSGFFARFALQYNLFAGTVIALGSPHQVTEFLYRNEVNPSLGCFAMTEQRTGDQNGFLIGTTAELTRDELSFVLHTPTDTAAKTWISQGLLADQAVVIATMVVHGHSYGPQAFLIGMRDHQGKLREGITVLDMGIKEAGSDLDNARITFDHLRIPLSSHLCGYLQVTNGVVRHPLGRKVRIMDIIGQRLFTARVLVAQGALSYARARLEKTSNASDVSRMCWTPRVGPNSSKGHVSKGFLSHAFQTMDSLDSFCGKVEAELCQCLVKGLTPRERLQQAIAVAKIEAVETSIAICSKLRPEPSYNMGRDFLECCKCTEGDSHVLIQKMARDLARSGGAGSNWQVMAALDDLKQEMIQVQMGSKCKTMEAWDRCGELVYAVAEAQMDSVLRSYGCLFREEAA